MNHNLIIFVGFLLLSIVSCKETSSFVSSPGQRPSETQETSIQTASMPGSSSNKTIVRKSIGSFEFDSDIRPRPDTGEPVLNIVFITDNSQSMLPYQSKLIEAVGGLVESVPKNRVQLEAYSSTLLSSNVPGARAPSNGEGLYLPPAGLLAGTVADKGLYSPKITVSEQSGDIPFVQLRFEKQRSLFNTPDGKLVLHSGMNPSEWSVAKEILKGGILVGNKGSSSEQSICNLLKLVHEEGPDAPFTKNRGALVVLTTDANPFDASRTYNCAKSMNVSYKKAPSNKVLNYSYYVQRISQAIEYPCGDDGSQTCAGSIAINRSNCGVSGVCDPNSQLNVSRACTSEENALLLAQLAATNASKPDSAKSQLKSGSACNSVLGIAAANKTLPSSDGSCAAVVDGSNTVSFETYMQSQNPNALIVTGKCKDVTPVYAFDKITIEYYPGLSASSTASDVLQVVRAKLAEITGGKGYSFIAIANHSLVNPPGMMAKENESVLLKDLLGNAFSAESFRSVFSPSFSGIEDAIKKYIENEVGTEYDLPAGVDTQKIVAGLIEYDNGSLRNLDPSDYETNAGKLKIKASNLTTNIKKFHFKYEE